MLPIKLNTTYEVRSRFRPPPETLFLCPVIGHFLSVSSLAKLQFVGITCMFTAAKVEETISPAASNFLYCVGPSYSETEISAIPTHPILQED